MLAFAGYLLIRSDSVYLSSANGTTAGATLSPCITATYVPVAPPWRFAIIRGYTLTLHKDRVFPVGVREKIVWRGYRQR
jgi:hypothetical protein